MPCCLCLWHICHHSKPWCHILDVYNRMCRHVDCHHPLVCLPRILFQQWLDHVIRPKPFSRLTKLTIVITCQLTGHDIVDQPCDCYQETETCSEELPPPGISCTVLWLNLQECFLQNFNMQKFQNMEHSNSRTFQGLSRTYSVFKDFQGPGIFFPKIQGLSRTSQGPYEPCKSV